MGLPALESIPAGIHPMRFMRHLIAPCRNHDDYCTSLFSGQPVRRPFHVPLQKDTDEYFDPVKLITGDTRPNRTIALRSTP